MTSHPEISLRHLPDQSDSSLSFQIPQAANVADLLLADADDFLNGNEFSFTTPAPPKTILDEPLTLSQLTPPPRGTPNRVGLRSPSNQSPHTICTSPFHRKILGRREIEKNTPRAIDSPISKERLAHLKEEVDSLDFAKPKLVVTGSPPAKLTITPAEPTTTSAGSAENSTIERPKRPIRKKKANATVVDGGSIKNKLTQSSSNSGALSASRRTGLTRSTTGDMIRPKNKRDKKKTEDTSTSSVAKTNVGGTTTGTDERLLMNGKNVMMTHRPGNIEDHEKVVTDNSASVELVDTPSPTEELSAHHHDPLTLSQISPQKQHINEAVPLSTAATTQDGAPSALKPLKTRKVNAPGLTHKSARAAGLSNRKYIIASSSRLRSSPKREYKLSSRIHQARSGRNLAPETSQANVPGPSRRGRGPTVSVAQTNLVVGRSRSSSSVPHSMYAERNETEVPSIPTRPKFFNATKPVEHSDARLQARKNGTSETEQHATTSFRDGIPDFRALHERHLKASIAFRKEHIVPTVPVTPNLNTELRAKEREKFDELMRRREEEMERVREEKRRQRDAEDEKEIREIRKRAIPKAHDVPDWYASAPKRRS